MKRLFSLKKLPSLKQLSCMKRLVCVPFVLFALVSTAQASAPQFVQDSALNGVLSSVIYSIIGIAMALLAYKLIDLMTPGHLSRQLSENHNIALAIVVGLLMLGICIIIAATMVG